MVLPLITVNRQKLQNRTVNRQNRTKLTVNLAITPLRPTLNKVLYIYIRMVQRVQTEII